jgi:hypothetical protein
LNDENEIPDHNEETQDETSTDESVAVVASAVVPAADGMQWLMPSVPTAASETFEYGAKGPLYTATVSLVRTRKATGWVVQADGTLKLPLGKKGQAGFASEWVNGASVFTSYREMGPSPIEWRRVAAGFETQKPERETHPVISEEKIAALGMPIFSATDLMFVITEAWPTLGPLGGLFFAAGNKVFALLLVRKTEKEVEARMLAADFLKTANERADEIFARLPWPEARSAELIWDPARKAIGTISVRLPMLGNVRVQLARHE